MTDAVDDIVKRVLKVASLPQIYLLVEETLNDNHSSVAALGKIIEEDPALTSKLLRLANSAFYSFAAKVEAVNQAITVLGTQQLRDLVLACSVLRVFSNIPDNIINMESFWRHSIACGVVARNIAAARKETNIERFFVAGLLHDIGRLVFLMEKPKQMAEAFHLARQNSELLHVAEKEIFGFNHAKLGGRLLDFWRLSPRLVESISYHHSPRSARQFTLDATIIHVADSVANALELGTSGQTLVPPISIQAWKTLDIPNQEISSIIDMAVDQYDDAVQFVLAE
ncbi:HDOD domain-containing protein [Aurantivibrio plasticivorans]